jgi:hypothetical protein
LGAWRRLARSRLVGCADVSLRGRLGFDAGAGPEHLVLPRATTTSPRTPIGVHTFHVCQALSRPHSCLLYDFAILYGAPDESTGGGADNTPATFLHFEVIGGRGVGQALSLQKLAGTVPLQRLIGHRTIAGLHSWSPHTATLRLLAALIAGLKRV